MKSVKDDKNLKKKKLKTIINDIKIKKPVKSKSKKILGKKNSIEIVKKHVQEVS